MVLTIWPDGRAPVAEETIELAASGIPGAWQIIRSHINRKRPDWRGLRRFWVLRPGAAEAELWTL